VLIRFKSCVSYDCTQGFVFLPQEPLYYTVKEQTPIKDAFIKHAFKKIQEKNEGDKDVRKTHQTC